MTGNINEHLKKVEDDQLINGIDTVENTVRNDAGRHYAVSQLLQPVYLQGYYDNITGRYVNGDWRQSMVPNSSWTTTSAAALTLTCATGHRYRVYYAGARNATQATLVTLSGSIGGNAWTNFNIEQATGATTTLPVIGGGNQYYDGIGVAGTNAIKEIWLNAGDTLTMTLSVYAAGNNTEHMFMFEDYTL